MVREVLVFPHPKLKQSAARVERIDDMVRAVVQDMLDTMAAHNRCVGIAAPQIGVLLRIIVVDVSTHPKAGQNHGRLVLINPRIARAEGSAIGREGCLSLPEITANVRRAERVEIEADCLDGERFEACTEGFEARALQHEIDHLDGVLILDRAASASEVFPRVQPARKQQS